LDFFEQQERSRRSSRWLIAWVLLAVLCAVASYCAVAGLLYGLLAAYGALPLAGSAPLEWKGLAPTYLAALVRVPPAVYVAVAGLVSSFILAASAWRMWQLREGGSVIAELLGARLVEPGRCTPPERKLLNVVEELAIASGVTVPPVYLLDREAGINALVAGYSPHEAAIIVTRGAAEKLSRDELQGVMGHEYSHILNGDMALNLRLVGLLAGLTCIGDWGDRLVYRAGALNAGLDRGRRGAGVLEALAGALMAFIAFPATLAADAIKAAVSRERERLADAASVQFTRNPDAIAGALDSILALRAHTAVLAAHTEQLAHMFFAPAVSRWWGFPTHPPIVERIGHIHPRFQREEYRRTRHGERSRVAVLDGAGNVVKTIGQGGPDAALGSVALVASIGRPRAQHLDYSTRLLAQMPSRLRDALHKADEAESALFSLALSGDEASRALALRALEEKRGRDAAARAADLRTFTEPLGRSHALTLAELGVPAIKAQRQDARNAFLADLSLMVGADRRVTLSEFVLVTLLQQRLREGAGLPIRTRYGKLQELDADAHAVLSLVARAAGEDAAAAFARGAAVLRAAWPGPLDADALTLAKIEAALERLRHLSPFAKPGLLKACVEAASSGGAPLPLAQAGLVRMVAATLDCPVPPILAARDQERLAA
jgi:Zn-dependent protease with chaperone function